jgi:hypothetical protein
LLILFLESSEIIDAAVKNERVYFVGGLFDPDSGFLIIFIHRLTGVCFEQKHLLQQQQKSSHHEEPSLKGLIYLESNS